MVVITDVPDETIKLAGLVVNDVLLILIYYPKIIAYFLALSVVVNSPVTPPEFTNNPLLPVSDVLAVMTT